MDEQFVWGLMAEDNELLASFYGVDPGALNADPAMRIQLLEKIKKIEVVEHRPA